MRCCCMMPHDRDLSILKHIVSYCEQIDMAMGRFGRRYEIFAEDPVYRNAVSLCILQMDTCQRNSGQRIRQSPGDRSS